MTVIQDREYVERKEGRFRPTELGTIVNELLVASFDDLFNVEYTARHGGGAGRDRRRQRWSGPTRWLRF